MLNPVYIFVDKQSCNWIWMSFRSSEREYIELVSEVLFPPQIYKCNSFVALLAFFFVHIIISARTIHVLYLLFIHNGIAFLDHLSLNHII